MKLGLFADSHYRLMEQHGRRFHKASLGKIKETMNAFQEEKVDFIVCLGDIIDVGETPEESINCLEEAMEPIRAVGIPYRIIPGNHDYAAFAAEDFAARTGCPMLPCTVETDTHKLILLDANYREDFRRYDIAGVQWKDTNLPPEQLEFLKKELAASSKPCIVLLHENLDTEIHISHVVKSGGEEARQIIEESGKCNLIIQGHYHPGADREANGIRYLTLPAMCEKETDYYMILDL